MKHTRRTRPSCGSQFSLALMDRLEEAVYQIIARALVKSEAKSGYDPEDFTFETFRNTLETDKAGIIAVFHEVCDQELLCPHCGQVHATLDTFLKYFGHVLDYVTSINCDFPRLHKAILLEREKHAIQ